MKNRRGRAAECRRWNTSSPTASARSIDAFDEEMERQLQEAMGGMSDKDLYGEPAEQARRGKPRARRGRRRARSSASTAQDVFIDLPGGRTQGVLPLLQFPDGPPAIGTEVDVHIEGFDHANGVLLAVAQGRGRRRPTGRAWPSA